MDKLSRIQKRNNLNEVYRDGEIGPGGAYHEYKIVGQVEPEELYADNNEEQCVGFIATIAFQKGPRKDHESVHGVLDTDLLEIVRDRLKCFQAGDFSCRENACALTHIEEALMWMNKRVEDRAERNVLGTNEK